MSSSRPWKMSPNATGPAAPTTVVSRAHLGHRQSAPSGGDGVALVGVRLLARAQLEQLSFEVVVVGNGRELAWSSFPSFVASPIALDRDISGDVVVPSKPG